MEQDLTQFAVLIIVIYDNSTGCDEMGVYIATEADTMIDIVCVVDLKKKSEYSYSIGTFNYFSSL